MDSPRDRDEGDDEHREPWRPDEDEGEDHPEDPSGSGRSEMPSLRVELPSGHHILRGLARGLCAVAIVAAACAVIAIDQKARAAAELLALVALVVGSLATPVMGVARRLAGYPARGLFEIGRRGFRLPWLNREAPGPEGPWEALRGFAVRPVHGGRLLVLEVAAGRFALTDRSLGEQAFDAAVEVLEKAVGPEGVLLGTLVRLPIHPTDRRGFLERKRPWLIALALGALFVLLASQATLLAIRLASAFGAFATTLVGSAVQHWNRMPGAELVLALDGLIVPLPNDLRKTIKLPFASLRRGAVEDKDGEISLVIEHEKGRLLYPLEWFDAREAKEFARQLADRAG